jgi:hypothetical protein
MKLLIVGWYNLINPIITAKDYFTILGYDVYFLPLLYYNQKYSGEQLSNALISFIKNIDPVVMLWWNWESSKEVLYEIKIKTQNILHILFNWDHPFCLSSWDNNNNRKIISKNIWDICFLTADCKLDEYINSGSDEAYYLRMFADENIHFPEIDKSYECDVSFICTNLYDDKVIFPNVIVNRREILTNIINNGFNVHIYGPEHLKDIFPNQYKGFCHFLNNNKVFYNSKINLCTHVDNGYKYCNERVGTILSSGGLMMCDKVDGIETILTNNKDFILFDENNYIEQIRDIINNYDRYVHIKENAVITARNKFSPKYWSEFIDSKIKNYLQKKSNILFSLKEKYDFYNYQRKKISIILTHYNRNHQLIHTLETFQESNYPKDLIEVICYDDRSDKEPCIIDLSRYNYNIKIIYANFEKDESIINPGQSYNNAFKYINGEYVIIQNSECMHIGDIITYVIQNLKENTLISFPCWATGNEDISLEMFNNRHNSIELERIINEKWRELKNYPENFKGWYNEKILRPECLHFCNAIHINTLKRVGLFNTSIEKLLGFDDNDFAQRLMFNYNLNVIIPDHNYSTFVIHQNHDKYNKPRSNELFLKSYYEYRKINNIRINNYNNSKIEKINNTLYKKYNEIEINKFMEQLVNEYSTYFVYLIITENDEVDYKFIRNCLKNSNFRLQKI